MSQTWPVTINGKNPASFDPDVFGTNPGEPLKAQMGDLVCWNNQTADQHQIQVRKKDGSAIFTTKMLEKFKSSSPGYCLQKGDDENTGTIKYYCTQHANESGEITVVTS